MQWRPERYAVIVADDFGRSSSVNLAIAEAHDRGILSAASIMAGEKAFEEAVSIARNRSRLSVGLHVTLCSGKSVLPHSEIPDLVDVEGCFEGNPSLAWIKYGKRILQKQLDTEIGAQFDRLEEAGIHPGHVDSHHHLHMHPMLFAMICRHAVRRGIQWIRIPNEPLSLVFHGRDASRGALPFVEWAALRILRMCNASKIRSHGLQALPHVYGLSRTGRLDEQYLFDLFTQSGNHMEIFSHPDIATESGRKELEALTSSAVRDRLKALGISVTGYRQLSHEALPLNTEMANGL
jgi:hopanoid biosynthesis associated protein HpnK